MSVDAQDIFKVSWWKGIKINMWSINFPQVVRWSAAHQVTNNHRAWMNTTELLWENECSFSCACCPKGGPVMTTWRESVDSTRSLACGLLEVEVNEMLCESNEDQRSELQIWQLPRLNAVFGRISMWFTCCYTKMAVSLDHLWDLQQFNLLTASFSRE